VEEPDMIYNVKCTLDSLTYCVAKEKGDLDTKLLELSSYIK